MATVGTYAANFHEGSRSEILADYLFSAWGTVTPVRRQDDYGLDLYCTLMERLGQRALVRDYFVVQVKSDTAAWVFTSEESVRWLVEYPMPLFLACVDKGEGVVRVYHLVPRFFLWALGKLPDRLELKPEETVDGSFNDWGNGETFSLSAPIIQVTLEDLISDDRMGALRQVFAYWVRLDRENCDLVRQGLLRFRMPPAYRVNEVPAPSIAELGNAVPETEFLRRGIVTLAEGAECISGQLGRRGDRMGALLGALLLDHLQRNYGGEFEGNPRWQQRVPADLGRIVCGGLNEALVDNQRSTYQYRGLEAVEKMLIEEPLVKRFLAGPEAAERLLKTTDSSTRG
jgi:hypothetical protein